MAMLNINDTERLALFEALRARMTKEDYQNLVDTYAKYKAEAEREAGAHLPFYYWATEHYDFQVKPVRKTGRQGVRKARGESTITPGGLSERRGK